MQLIECRSYDHLMIERCSLQMSKVEGLLPIKGRSIRLRRVLVFWPAFAERLLVIAFLVFGMLTLHYPNANAQQDPKPEMTRLQDEWSKDAAAIDSLLADRQCDKAWDLLLKHVMMGNRQAFLKTAGAIGAIHGPALRLPGAPTDALSTLRIMTSFAALALDGEHPQAARNFLALLTVFRAPCGEDFDAAACHKYVLEQNIVPSREAFLKEIANYRSTANAGAFCAAQPHP